MRVNQTLELCRGASGDYGMLYWHKSQHGGLRRYGELLTTHLHATKAEDLYIAEFGSLAVFEIGNSARLIRSEATRTAPHPDKDIPGCSGADAELTCAIARLFCFGLSSASRFYCSLMNGLPKLLAHLPWVGMDGSSTTVRTRRLQSRASFSDAFCQEIRSLLARVISHRHQCRTSVDRSVIAYFQVVSPQRS